MQQTPDCSEKPVASRDATLAAVVFIALIILINVPPGVRALTVWHWPVIQGRVVDTEIDAPQQTSEGIENRTVVFYEYTLLGEKYAGVHVVDRFGEEFTNDDRRLFEKRYHKGALVAVHYNPDDYVESDLSVQSPLLSPSWFIVAPGSAILVCLVADLVARGRGKRGGHLAEAQPGELTRPEPR